MIQFNSNPAEGGGLPPELRAQLKQVLDQEEASAPQDIQAALDAIVQDYNNTSQATMGGFSPKMLHTLYNHPMGSPESPLQFSDQLTIDELSGSKSFIRIRQFLLALHETGRVKSTPKGNFTRGFVTEMVDVFFDTKTKEQVLSYHKVLNEEDVFPLHIARIICKLSGLIGISKGHYSVRKKSLPLLKEESAGKLYRQLFLTYFTKFNIGYRTRLRPELDWLQYEVPYALKPLQDRGATWIEADQLCQQLLHPMALAQLESDLSGVTYFTPDKLLNIYVLEPLEEWGLLEIQREKVDRYTHRIQRIRKSPLLDQFISFE